MVSISPIPPVVPSGRRTQTPQPVLGLPHGLPLRPWHSPDADVLVTAGQDPAIHHLLGLLRFKAGTGGQAVEYLGMGVPPLERSRERGRDHPLSKVLHKALDLYMSRR